MSATAPILAYATRMKAVVMPIPPKPISIIAQVACSGTPATSKFIVPE